MATTGSIYIDLSSYGYDNIDLGCFRTQSESTEFIGSEQVSAYGTLQVFNIAAKKQWKLTSPPYAFTTYMKIRNFLISTLGSPQEVFLPTENGNVIAKIRITGAERVLASNGTNDEYELSLDIKQV